jgi:acylphosphatase
MKMKRYHIVVSGFVQGVGFRYFVNEAAVKLHLTGWARNSYDGTVEIEAQGDEEAIARLIEKLKIGSRFSTVDDVSSKEIDVKDKEKSFRYMF